MLIGLAATMTPGTLSTNNKSGCDAGNCDYVQGYLWFGMVLASCSPFIAFCCCCVCNKWYLTSGPFAGLTDDEICPQGQQFSYPLRIFCAWCCPGCCRRPTIPPAAAAAADAVQNSGNAEAAVSNAELACPPPSYEAALTMSRPKEGDVVVFVNVNDQTLCSFKLSTDSHCDPPTYRFTVENEVVRPEVTRHPGYD